MAGRRLWCLGAVLAVMAMLPASAGAASWHAQSMAIPQTVQGQLFSVSCGAPGRCEGVGQTVDAVGNTRALAESWNGHTWQAQSIPSLDAMVSSLNAVSCSSATSCLAVGSYQTVSSGGAFAERWDGTSWTVEVMPSDSAATDFLNSISCTATDACTAVGQSFDNRTGAERPLVEVLTPFGWQFQNSPEPANVSGAFLNSVSCTAPGACTAVGASFTGFSAPTPYAQSRSGPAAPWALETVPAPPGSQFTVPQAVSCAAAQDCQLVGTWLNATSQKGLAEHWNGFTWTVENVPTPSGYQYANLAGVSCASARACVAVGGVATNTTSTTAAEVWNGTRWAVQTTPSEPGGFLGSVSCPRATSCAAIGAPGLSTTAALWRNTGLATRGAQFRPGLLSQAPRVSSAGAAAARANSPATGGAASAAGSRFRAPADVRRLGVRPAGLTSLTLAEGWNGSAWAVEPTPAFTGAAFSQMYGTSCWDAQDCFATGIYGDNNTGQQLPLLERETHGVWTVAPFPAIPGTVGGRLFDVSCTSARACEAVGEAFTPAPSELAFAAQWNGSEWAVHSLPGAGGLGSALGSVSCPAASTCTAAGALLDDSNGTLKTLAERWNGSAWVAQTTADTAGNTSDYLYAISCANASTCMSVGGYNNNTGAGFGAMSELWSGGKWVLKPVASAAGGGFGIPGSVSCTAPDACAAAGSFVTATSGGPLAEHWDGLRWTKQTVPTAIPYFNGVVCVNGTACLGTSDGTSGVWNGVSWTPHALAPPPAGAFPSLLGAACAQGECTAVGSALAGEPIPLAEAFS